MATMDRSDEYDESPMEGDDIAYTCQGCGEVRSDFTSASIAVH